MTYQPKKGDNYQAKRTHESHMEDNPKVIEIVRFLARYAAEKDFEKSLKDKDKNKQQKE